MAAAQTHRKLKSLMAFSYMCIEIIFISPRTSPRDGGIRLEGGGGIAQRGRSLISTIALFVLQQLDNCVLLITDLGIHSFVFVFG